MRAHSQVIQDQNLKKRGTDFLGVSRNRMKIMRADAHLSFMEEMNVRLSLEDLKVFNRDEDAVQLPDGSGYAGSLNVYHEIHCVVSPPLLPVVTSLQVLADGSFRNGCIHKCIQSTTIQTLTMLSEKQTDYIPVGPQSTSTVCTSLLSFFLSFFLSGVQS